MRKAARMAKGGPYIPLDPHPSDAIGRASNYRQSDPRLAVSAPRTIHLRARGRSLFPAPVDGQFPVGPKQARRPEVLAMPNLEIMWTKVDEAPALATYSLLPIVKA